VFDLIKDNLQNIVLIVGAVAILFWPQVSAAIKSARGEGGGTDTPPPPSPSNSCGCCCPEEPEIDAEAPKSDWVVEVMRVRTYCLSHKLTEGVRLSEELITVLVAGKPDIERVNKAVVVTKKEVR
jgi:hypothetical protein